MIASVATSSHALSSAQACVAPRRPSQARIAVSCSAQRKASGPSAKLSVPALVVAQLAAAQLALMTPAGPALADALGQPEGEVAALPIDPSDIQKNSGEVIDKVTNEALPELEKNLSQIKGNQINDNQEQGVDTLRDELNLLQAEARRVQDNKGAGDDPSSANDGLLAGLLSQINVFKSAIGGQAGQ